MGLVHVLIGSMGRMAGAGLAALGLMLVPAPAQAQAPTPAPTGEPLGSTQIAIERWYIPDEPIPADFEDNPLAYHPSVMYQRSLEAYETGDGPSAGYWMYYGQLRYRIRITCFSLNAFARERELFVASDEDIGRLANVWIGGDLQLWIDTLSQVAADYEGQPDPYIESPRCDDARTQSMAGMLDLRSVIAGDVDGFRSRRASNGLENRTTGPVTVPEG